MIGGDDIIWEHKLFRRNYMEKGGFDGVRTVFKSVVTVIPN